MSHALFRQLDEPTFGEGDTSVLLHAHEVNAYQERSACQVLGLQGKQRIATDNMIFSECHTLTTKMLQE